MRLNLFFIVFILFSVNVGASWQTYQNDLRNTGASNGTGYFPLKTANFSVDLGMDFQPLVGNLDSNGNNEIVIFSNNSLIIFNPQLNKLNQVSVGAILGQPALFDFDNDGLTEIIFNSRQNLTDYFFAYQYNNSNLKQEFNITLSNDANFSGIKCFTSSDNFCVFKDKKNYINIVNMTSKANSTYNTSVYDETRQTVPAIGDIDNDGNLEAVFWFNEDNSSGYGFLVFDLNERRLDNYFNHSGIVDNIFSPIILGPSLFHQLFTLKGQPVLVDLNNDNKLEIAASVFYDDTFLSENSNDDQYTELFVYSPNGTKLFSKCETGSSGCNDAIGGNKLKLEGTNPFVLDANNDGIDDICFIKDKKRGGIFKNMTINCYNYSGGLLLDSELIPSLGAVKAAIAADINNDGRKEIITENHAYMQNGNSIFMHNLDSGFVVPADIDGNKGLDLVWTFGNQTKVFLDNLNYSIDLSIDSFDISFLKLNKTHVNVSAIIKNIGEVEANNIKTIIYNTETLENKTALLNARKGSNATFNSVLALKEGEKVLVSVDFDNEVNESNEENNFAFREFVGLPYVFVSADLEPFNANPEFQGYIKNKLTSGYYVTDSGKADVEVYIGKYNPRNQDNNIKTKNDFEFGYDYGNIVYNDKVGSNPYSGLAGAFKDSNGKVIVMVVGNEIEGSIAAAKEFVKNQATLLNVKDKDAVFIDDENADAVKVYDYLHLGGNNEHYKLSDDEFRKIVHNALNDEMFNVFDKSVVTNNGITLRLRNLKPNVSNDYLEYLNSTGVPVELPVVVAHGLFSNLTTWEGLGSEISNTGRDTWLIEITGGTGQDCDNCIDYTFYNLTDIFVPALLNGVLSFTGKDKLQYVGFSNGCRAALDSLERNQFDSNKIETFVAVGCPGAFEKLSLLDSGVLLVNDTVIENLQNKNIKHIDVGDMLKLGLFNRNIITKNENGKISLNLWKNYLNLMSSSNDNQPGKVTLTKFGIIQGNALGTSDGIITTIDENSIYSNVKLKNSLTNIKPIKQSFKVFAFHSNLDTRSISKTLIRRLINNEDLTFFERTFHLLNESNVIE